MNMNDVVPDRPSEKEPQEESQSVVLDSVGVRTYFIFLDVPYHYEYSVGTKPILPVGLEIEMDLRLSNPKNPARVRDVSGTYRITRRKLVYSTKRPGRMGLTQYVEFLPANRPAG
jgi:hypothetical protein